MAKKERCFWHNDRSAVVLCTFCGMPICDECHKGALCNQCIEKPPKSKKKALIFAIFLGWLGVHRYYMGFYFTGVLYTISFGIIGIGWALDVIRILFMSTIDKNKQPYYTGDNFPYCTVGIKIKESNSSVIGDLTGAVGDAILDGMSSETIKWFYRLLWRDKLRRPLLRFDQESERQLRLTKEAGEAKSTKSKVVLIILSILLGWLGVDRFFAGRIGLGILKLLTGGGFYLWWLIDIILAIMGLQKDSHGNYIDGK